MSNKKCILIAIGYTLLLVFGYHIHKNYKVNKVYKDRNELIREIRSLANETEKEYPCISIILFTLYGSMVMNDEFRLSLLSQKYSEYMLKETNKSRTIYNERKRNIKRKRTTPSY